MASKQEQSVQGLIDAHIKSVAAATVKRQLAAAIEDEIESAVENYGLFDDTVRKTLHKEFLEAAKAYIKANPDKVAKRLVDQALSF